MKLSKGTENLRTLYAVMRGVPDEAVDLRHWRRNSTHTNEQLLANVGSNALGCGTAACAVGWACAYPEFNKQGLTWVDHMPTLLLSGHHKLHNWEAVFRFFGVEDEAFFLFQNNNEEVKYKPDLYEEDNASESSRTRVLRRIRAYLLDKGVITHRRYTELAAEEAREHAHANVMVMG